MKARPEIDIYIIELLVEEVLEQEDMLIPSAITADELHGIDRQAANRELWLALLPYLSAKYAYWGQVGRLKI